MPILANGTPRTQKAKGIKALTALGFTVPPARLISTPVHLAAFIQEQLDEATFVRPCPLTPRPGFVDSRMCTSPAAVAKVWAEMRKVEPQGELLLMPFQKADLNVVLTPGLMTIGPGHDGATAGKQAIGIPLVGEDPTLADHHKALAILPGEVPHVEAVITQNAYGPAYQSKVTWTQCRSGQPHPGGGPDYVPAAIAAVTAIVEPCEDFIEWEAKVQAGFPEGTVVYGKGHTLGTHAALHCLKHKVPFITSHCPKVGQQLAATATMPAYDVAAFRHGFGVGMTRGFCNGVRDILSICYGLHNAAALRGDSTYWIGLAAAKMFRYGMQAGDVELSIHHHTDSVQASYATANHWLQPLSSSKTPQKAVDFCHLMTEIFFEDLTSGGIGGIKWAWCTNSLLTLAHACQQACASGPDADPEAVIMAVVGALNSAINQAHNGGFWMNKFGCSESTFTDACQGRWQRWLECANVLWADAAQTFGMVEEHIIKAWSKVTVNQEFPLLVHHATVQKSTSPYTQPNYTELRFSFARKGYTGGLRTLSLPSSTTSVTVEYVHTATATVIKFVDQDGKLAKQLVIRMHRPTAANIAAAASFLEVSE